MMRGMASSSYHVRRPWPAAPVAWDEASSSRRRTRKRPRRPPVTPPDQASSPSLQPPISPPNVPTSPSYAPTSPSYSPTDPLNSAPAAYSPEEPRHVEDVIGEEPGSDGQYGEEEEQRSGSERDGSDGYDGEEDDQQAREEEEEPPRRRRRHDEEEQAGESDGEQDFSDGSDGENSIEDDDEQQASHLVPAEEPLQVQLHDEEQQRRSGSERDQEHQNGSDGGNGVEDEHRAGGEEEAPPPQAHGEDAAAAADGDLSAAPPRPSSPALSIRSESSSAVVGEMTVDRTAGLDCGICFHPLKPPIFQCDVGHVVCSSCRDKLAARGQCHVCRDPTEFRRCHAMEQVVDAIRVPCPHAAHGCANRPAYHDRERHARECPHAPYRCPAAGPCGFSGNAPALAEHVAAVHGWPCTTEPASHGFFGIDLRDGFNFLISDARGGNCGGAQHLLLLNVASTPFGRAVSVVRARPQAATSISSPVTASNTACGIELRYSSYKLALREHTQRSRIHVAWADLSAGLPDPRTSFQFFVPKYAGGHGDDEVAFHVSALIAIS
ncbi:unnamed protein product [Urochloa humidicola]